MTPGAWFLFGLVCGELLVALGFEVGRRWRP